MPRSKLSAEIAALLCAKLVALCALYFAFFSAPPPVDAGGVRTHLTGR